VVRNADRSWVGAVESRLPIEAGEQDVALETVRIDEYPPVETSCLRCGEPVVLRFTGPCKRCTAELHASLVGEPREIDSEYVPQVNVTPNAVALKDD
jgi:hypothetical protein